MNLGERLRSARRIARVSQEELARRAGVTKQSVSKYERGEAVPGSRVLLAMAEALGLSAEFFLRPRSMPQLGRLAYRKHKTKLSRSRQMQVEERVREWLERCIDLEGLVPAEWRPSFELPQGWPRVVHGLDEVEEAAVALRSTWQLGLDPIESVVDLLEGRGVRVFFLDAPDGFDGLTFSSQGDGAPVIVVSEAATGDRQRFSMLHELGHFVLDLGQSDPERAAHRFAAAFLLPRPTALEEFGRERRHLAPGELLLLKQKWGLSMQALARRAWDLGVIGRSSYLRLCREFSSRGWRKEEPGRPVQRENPKRMRQLAARALAEGFLSRPRAAELLGQPLSEFSNEPAPDEPATATTGD